MNPTLEAQEPGAEQLPRSKSSLDRGFDLATSATNGISALRELVLAAALRGRLDDPGRPLLDGAIGVGSHAPQLLRRFALPEGWRWRTVGELCALRTGATPSTARREYYEGGTVKWLVSGDIHSREIFDCEGRITELAMSNANCKLLPADSVLIALNGQGKTRATVAILRVEATCNQSLVAMTPRPDSDLTPEFLFWNLRYRYREIRDITGQKQRRGLNMGLVSELSVAVPPRAEQARIVARVEELMRLCDALEAKGRLEAEQHARLLSTLLGTLTESRSSEELAANWQRVATHFDLLLDRPEAVEALEQTILQLAVRGLLVPQDPNDEAASELLDRVQAEKEQLISTGAIKRGKPLPAVAEAERPFELPPGWSWARLEAVSILIVDCPHSTPKFVDKGHLCIDTNSFKDGVLLPHKLRYVDDETFLERVARTRPQPGDLVFAREGSVGQSLIIPAGTVSCLGQRVMLFRFSSHVSNEFMRLAISSTSFLEGLLALHKGIGAKHVNVGDMRHAVVPLPPYGEQLRILSRVTELRRLCADLRQRLIAQQTTQTQLAEALVATA